MKKLISTLALVVCFALLPTPAFAHELIKDDTKTSGVILHISPDDEPIAGKTSTLFFDLQNVSSTQKFTASLSITKDSQPAVIAPLVIDGNTASTKFAFPTSGTYNLKLDVTANDKALSYHLSQTVAPGGESIVTTQHINIFALAAFVAGVAALAVLVTVAFLRRKRIAAQSQR